MVLSANLAAFVAITFIILTASKTSTSFGASIPDIAQNTKAVQNADTIPAVMRKESPAIVLYEHRFFKGRSITLTSSVANLRQFDFNDKVSSIKVLRGVWSVHEHSNYKGHRNVLMPGGEFPFPSGFRDNDISSVWHFLGS